MTVLPCSCRKHLPTKSNREIRNLVEEVRLLILELAKATTNNNGAEHSGTYNSLLHAIINGASGPGHGGTSEDFIVSNCKAIYFAGHETTAVTAVWCLMLLATHPEWQERARVEALEVCHSRSTLDANGLQRLKTVSN
jgi:cytochrome P450